MKHDRYGLELSTVSAAAAELYAGAQERMLAHGARPAEPLLQSVALDPKFALAQAALALHLLREQALPEARAAAAAAQQLAGGTTPREQRHIAIVVDTVGGHGARALAGIDEHLGQYPRDALLLQTGITNLLFSGRQDEMIGLTGKVEHAYADGDPFFLGLHAFALEESGRFAEARSAAECSLERYPLAAFSTHALAHVFYETGAFADGTAFMPGWLDRYGSDGGMFLHLSWHLALFLLAHGEYTRVFELYERAIRPSAQLGCFQLFDPISLLWRTAAYADDRRPELWDELADHSEARAPLPGMIFADLHHGMALAAGGRWTALAALRDSLQARAGKGSAVAGEVALPLLDGLVAFAGGDFETAVAQIEPLEDRIFLVGGSRAQREVFHDTLLESLLRTQRFAAAETRLRKRLDARPAPRDFFRLARAAAASDDPTPARTAIARSLQSWATADSSEAQAARRLHAALAPA